MTTGITHSPIETKLYDYKAVKNKRNADNKMNEKRRESLRDNWLRRPCIKHV
jgi:hypothetical protein